MGRDTVSGMVVFINSKPAPKEYRRFRIKAQVNGDDLAAMKEALTRRFERAKSEDSRSPHFRSCSLSTAAGRSLT